MRGIIYDALSGLPTKVISNSIGLGSMVATAWPVQFRQWASPNVTAEQIRIFGIIGIVLFVMYWTLMIWLKPTDEGEKASVTFKNEGNTTYGGGSIHEGNATYGGGSIHVGDVHHHGGEARTVKDQLCKLLERINPIILVNINRGDMDVKIEFPDHVYHKFHELCDTGTGRKYVSLVQPYGSVGGCNNEVGPGISIRGVQNSGMATQARVVFTQLMKTV